MPNPAPAKAANSGANHGVLMLRMPKKVTPVSIKNKPVTSKYVGSILSDHSPAK